MTDRGSRPSAVHDDHRRPLDRPVVGWPGLLFSATSRGVLPLSSARPPCHRKRNVLERPTCVDCRKESPETETDYTLIGAQHGWRLTRTKAADGGFAIDWRCPDCWRAFKCIGMPSPQGGAASSSRPPPASTKRLSGGKTEAVAGAPAPVAPTMAERLPTPSARRGQSR